MDPSSVPSQYLTDLFSWGNMKMIGDFEDVMAMVQQALDFMDLGHKCICRIAQVTYDPSQDDDGDAEDDAETYSDNSFKLLICSISSQKSEELGQYLPRETSGSYYAAADQKKPKMFFTPENKNGYVYPIMLPAAMQIKSYGAVFGMLSVLGEEDDRQLETDSLFLASTEGISRAI
eukprot:gene29905-37313_t